MSGKYLRVTIEIVDQPQSDVSDEDRAVRHVPVGCVQMLPTSRWFRDSVGIINAHARIKERGDV